MEIGIGLPATIPGATGEQIIEWARAAEAHGFSSLGVIDRLVYGNLEPLVTLGAAAAATKRITLMTSILVAPMRANAALLAKQAASLNRLSGGRLRLGMAVGGYADDYEASGVPFAGRGRRFDEMLDEMTRIWAGEPRGFAGPIGPTPGLDRSQLVFGGLSRPTYRRVASMGGGWIAGSRGVEPFRQGAADVRRVWTEHGRDGDPWLMSLPYFCLGPRAAAEAAAFLTDHYAVEGGDTATAVASSALTTTEAIRAAIAEYEAAGCDELILYPCSADPRQVSLLADAVG
jgi:alkanesulfonate monooxygenase SsuD/methylene tetrahydromethanopterin reductase-like flavin-dependent oxidoreductase (luciferase family)